MSVAAGERPGVVVIVLAVLLPPIGVWLARGIGLAFWLSLVLTCLAYVPGMIFSLVVVLRSDVVERPRPVR